MRRNPEANEVACGSGWLANRLKARGDRVVEEFLVQIDCYQKSYFEMVAPIAQQCPARHRRRSLIDTDKDRLRTM
jgi:hypothetical protein